jgi:hypothetical protein
MSPFEIVIGALLAGCWVVTLAITRRGQRRRRVYPARGSLSFDDRDSLARFRRIMGR